MAKKVVSPTPPVKGKGKAAKGMPPPFVKGGGKAKGFPAGSNMKTEKKEEKGGKDLDDDGEKGEPAAHKAKVLGKPASPKKKG